MLYWHHLIAVIVNPLPVVCQLCSVSWTFCELEIYLLDRKGARGKMYVANRSGGNSSYALSPSDRKAVDETRSHALKLRNDVVGAQKDFYSSGRSELWWDANGFFNSSNKQECIQRMEPYRQIYHRVVELIEMVEKGDAGSYDVMLELIEVLSEMKRDTMRGSNSKAVTRVMQNFLREKFRLDHNLKRVECVLLRQEIRSLAEIVNRSAEAFVKMRADLKKALEENEDIKKCMREANDRAERRFNEANDRAERRLNEANDRAEQRFNEATRVFEARLRDLSEENSRNFQTILQKLMEVMERRA